MTVAVRRSDGSHRLEGTWAGTESANAFLSHLETRRFSPATVRAYAFDIVCLARFLEERGIGLGDLVPTDVFDWIDWQSLPRRRDGKVVPIGAGRGAAPASVDGVFFTELAAYLARERPPGLATPECFVVLHGPAAGRPLTEAGMRSMFRYHRQRSGAVRVRPHRLRHTYGTELEVSVTSRIGRENSS